MGEVNYVTQEVFDQLKSELIQLKTAGRAEVAKAIAEARDKGDLKENAEYDAAKEAQGLLEAKIAKLELSLANSRIIDMSTIDTSKVSILSTVKIKNYKTKKVQTYQIVSESEANLKAGKISALSPIAKGLIGKEVGDIAEVKTPGGIINLEILEISI